MFCQCLSRLLHPVTITAHQECDQAGGCKGLEAREHPHTGFSFYGSFPRWTQLGEHAQCLCRQYKDSIALFTLQLCFKINEKMSF